MPDHTTYIQLLEESRASSVERLCRNPSRFTGAINTAVLCVRARLTLDPAGVDDRTREAAMIAMQIAAAGFRAVTLSPDTTTEYRIGNAMRVLPAARTVHDAQPGNWLDALWLAVIARDQQRMTELAEVPVEILRRDNGVRYDEFFFHWVEALQAFWSTRPVMWEKLSAAVEMCRPERARDTDEEILGAMHAPAIAMFDRFVRNDRDGFVQALDRALHAHRRYWTASDDRKQTVSGNLPLGVVAIACLACDLGWSIEVESEYLPGGFLRPGGPEPGLS